LDLAAPALVDAVLLRLAGLDAQRPDAEADPPGGELGEGDCGGAEGATLDGGRAVAL
jgi:hypothetical protein